MCLFIQVYSQAATYTTFYYITIFIQKKNFKMFELFVTTFGYHLFFLNVQVFQLLQDTD